MAMTKNEATEMAKRLSTDDGTIWYVIQTLDGWRVSVSKPDMPFGLIYAYQAGIAKPKHGD